LAGFVPTENLRFREVSLNFKVSENLNEDDIKKHRTNSYPPMTKTMGGLKLQVNPGNLLIPKLL